MHNHYTHHTHTPTPTWSSEQADAVASRGSSWGFGALLQGLTLSSSEQLPAGARFEPTPWIRATTAPVSACDCSCASRQLQCYTYSHSKLQEVNRIDFKRNKCIAGHTILQLHRVVTAAPSEAGRWRLLLITEAALLMKCRMDNHM